MADVFGTATLTATSTLLAAAYVAGEGGFFNPTAGSSPQAVDFSDGSDTTALPPARGDATSNDLWFSIASTSSSLLTVNWSGSFDVGLELWAAPEDGVLTGVEDVTLLADSAGGLITDVGQDQLYFLRIYPLDDANNAGTGTLSWGFAARPDGLLNLDVDPVAYDAPSWLRISVLSATAGGVVEFRIDGVLVFDEEADESGYIVDFTVPVPDLTPGLHTLEALDVTTGQADSEPFEVTVLTSSPGVDPPGLGPTTPVSSDPVIRWVFEEVLPVGSTGLGETYTFPNNPSEMSTPHSPRIIGTDHTSAPDGQAILWEGVGPPVEWTIGGFCFDQAHAEALEHWHAQHRRFWCVDHLQRAWAVTFESLDWTPVKSTNPDHKWAARYRAKFFIYDGPVSLT